MMRHMAGDNERERANGERIAAGYPGAHPPLIREILKKREGRKTDASEFFDVRCPGERVSLRAGGCDIRIVTGQRSVEAPGKPESSETESAFGVGNVIEELADAPFSRGIPFEGFFFRYCREYRQEFMQLTLDNVERIVTDDLVDVGEIVRGGFVGLRAAVHGGDCNGFRELCRRSFPGLARTISARRSGKCR